MTTSEFNNRLTKYRNFQYHPLKSQYKDEKKELLKELNSRKYYKRLRIIRIIMFILAVVYLVAFVETATMEIQIGFAVLVVGVINLTGIILISIFKEKKIKKTDEYCSFIDKYKKLGVEEYNDIDVAKGGCIDKYEGYGICPVTGKILKKEEYEKCCKTRALDCEVFSGTLEI